MSRTTLHTIKQFIGQLLRRKEDGRVLAKRRHLENRRRLKLEEDRTWKNYKSRNRSMSRNTLDTIGVLNTINEEMMDQ